MSASAPTSTSTSNSGLRFCSHRSSGRGAVPSPPPDNHEDWAMFELAFRDERENNSAPSAPPPVPAPSALLAYNTRQSEVATKPLDMERAWSSFFNRCYEMGDHVLYIGMLSLEEVEEEAPFLYLGLPGITLLECVIRSLNVEGMQLAVGDIVTAKNCPSEYMDLLLAGEKLKSMWRERPLSKAEKYTLQCVTLFAGSKDVPSVEDANLQTHINRMSAILQSLSIQISQLPFYKKQFNSILSLLSTRAD